MSKEKNSKKRTSSFIHMLRHMFLGRRASEMTLADERYDSPSKLAVKRFFRKPLAVGALVVLIAMFAFVIIGPMFATQPDNYIESYHIHVAPNMSMMKLPSSMKSDPVMISSQGSFTLGLDKDGNVYMWGVPQASSKDANIMTVPDEVKNSKILFAAAGTDHCIAISDTGKVIGWGKKRNGQYGNQMATAGNPFMMPDELLNGTIDVENVKQLICSQQMTAILMNDGTMYAWGNAASYALNLKSMFDEVSNGVRFEKLAFTNTALFAISTDGKFVMGSNKQFEVYNSVNTLEYIGDRKVVDIVASGDTIVLLLDDNEIMMLGKQTTLPVIPEGETIKSLSAATRHFTLVTESGKVIAWGNGDLGQTNVPKKLQQEGAVDEVYSTGFQNYAFKDGKFVDSWGLKGYVMGTDDMGRDILNRVVRGGKMTMTVGAIAVIISSIIGVIIGCLSGYFGGKVDMILMRVTEIFSAIPFLPFAMILSAALSGSSVTENTRIIIIMVILGLLSWTGIATLVRGQILAEREKEFVTAAKSMGVKEVRIAFKHILPNIVSVIIVNLTLSFASCMLTEASLSYLGFGVKLPKPTWGNMLNGCNKDNVIQNCWWRWFFPALFLAVTVICINIIGDTLRDILDPKSEVEK